MKFTPQEGRSLAGNLRSIGQEHAADEYDRMSEDTLQALREDFRRRGRSGSDDPSATAIAWVGNRRMQRHPAFRYLRNPDRVREHIQLHLRHGPDDVLVAQAHAASLALQRCMSGRNKEQGQTLLAVAFIAIFGGAFAITAFAIPAAPQAFGTVKVSEGWQSLCSMS